ncbi:MAG: tetratricopeptide repeat protein [Raineya sp.]
MAVYQKFNQEPFNIGFARKNINDTTTLGQVQAAYLYNYLMASTPQDTMALHLSQKLLNTKANLAFSEWLNLSRKGFFFRNYLHQQGIETARHLNFISASDYKFLYAKYLLYLGESQKAATEFEMLKTNAFTPYALQDILYHLAIAHSESRNESKAKETWQKVLESGSTEKVKIAQKMIDIYKFEPQDWQKADDTIRFGLVYYRKTDLNDQIQIAKNIKNPDLKIKAVSHLMERLLESQEIQKAENLFNELPQDIETSLEVQAELNIAYLKLMYQKNDKKRVAEIIEKLPLSKRFESYRYFFRAWIAEESQAQEALKMYRKAIQANPFNLFFYSPTINLENKLGKPQEKGFDWAMQAIQFKDEAVEAWIIYFNQCLQAGFLDFVPSVLDKIKELNPNIYPKYQAIFQQNKR